MLSTKAKLVSDINQSCLDQLQEECAEVIQIISKIRRFGIDDVYAKIGKSNRERLEEELGHVQGLSKLLQSRGYVDMDSIGNHSNGRINRQILLELEMKDD